MSTAEKNQVEEVEKAPPVSKTQSQSFSQFQESLTQFSDTESKLQMTIDFMEASLAQNGIPHFRNFWEARKLSLELFKENIPSALRTVLWEKYTELSKEARRLKEILDEQCAFAVEQIEKAIQGIETDLTQIDENLKALPPLEYPFHSEIVQNNDAFYQKIQSELGLLNALASRISSLRKELIRTEMRVKQKNKFFKRLSTIGDAVFPKRKALIKEISDHFMQDVDGFIKTYFKGNLEGPLFNLRDEIKALQCIAKFLTLNTHAFNYTRENLSGCWDEIKQLERERRKERSEMKGIFKKNAEEVMVKIEEVKEQVDASSLPVQEALKRCSEISTFMRDIELGRDEVKQLKEALGSIQQVIYEKEADETEKQRQKNREKEELRLKAYEAFYGEVEQVIEEASELSGLSEKYDAFLEQQKSGDFTKREKQALKSLFNQLRDKISQKKEEAILSSSGDVGRQLQELRELFQDRMQRRSEVKEQIEVYRLAQGASASDFEQALSQSLLLEAEKERLDEINQSIKEVELKIAELEKQIGI